MKSGKIVQLIRQTFILQNFQFFLHNYSNISKFLHTGIVSAISRFCNRNKNFPVYNFRGPQDIFSSQGNDSVSGTMVNGNSHEPGPSNRPRSQQRTKICITPQQRLAGRMLAHVANQANGNLLSIE